MPNMTFTTPNPNSPLPAAMTLQEAADLLTVHPETLRRLGVKNKIPSVRIGTRWALPCQYVEDWINGHLAAWTQNPDGVWQRTPRYDIKTDVEEPEFRSTDIDPPSGGGLVQDPPTSE
jgi:excisionase family DNA binding protein